MITRKILLGTATFICVMSVFTIGIIKKAYANTQTQVMGCNIGSTCLARDPNSNYIAQGTCVGGEYYDEYGWYYTYCGCDVNGESPTPCS